MSDRNRWQQSAARESLHSKSPPYGRTSTQSGYGGRPTHGRSSNQIQLSPVREAPAQRLSNMAVINPPAINSSNRKRRYFHRGLLELYGFYKKFKILKVGNSNVILVVSYTTQITWSLSLRRFPLLSLIGLWLISKPLYSVFKYIHRLAHQQHITVVTMIPKI